MLLLCGWGTKGCQSCGVLCFWAAAAAAGCAGDPDAGEPEGTGLPCSHDSPLLTLADTFAVTLAGNKGLLLCEGLPGSVFACRGVPWHHTYMSTTDVHQNLITAAQHHSWLQQY
jgi:hypothetical protein